MSMSKEIPVEKYTRNINKNILNTGIFNNMNSVIQLKDTKSNSPYKNLSDTSEDVFFQLSKYSFNKMSPLIERAKASHTTNKFYGLFHKKDKNAFNRIINALNILNIFLEKPNSAKALTNDKHLKDLYTILEQHCISYLNSYCRITFTKEARQRKALAQSILKKCHKLISYYPNKDKPNLEFSESISDKPLIDNNLIDPNNFKETTSDEQKEILEKNSTNSSSDKSGLSLLDNNSTPSNDEIPNITGQISPDTSQNSTDDAPSVIESSVTSNLPNTNNDTHNLEFQTENNTPPSKVIKDVITPQEPTITQASPKIDKPIEISKTKSSLSEMSTNTPNPAKIKNNGHNSCYFDSLMLQLYNIDELRNAFLHYNCQGAENLASYLKQIFEQMQHSSVSNEVIILDILENKLLHDYPQIYNGNPKDAAEIYGEILENLEKEAPQLYNQISKITGVEINTSPNNSYISNVPFDFELDEPPITNSSNYLVIQSHTPLNNLQQERIVTLATGKNVKYSLIGCTLHQGKHYTSLVKNPGTNNWYHENDLSPRKTKSNSSFQNIIKSISHRNRATLLFYKKINESSNKTDQTKVSLEKQEAPPSTTPTSKDSKK